NGDGNLDLAVANQQDSLAQTTLSILINDGFSDGKFNAPQTVTLPSSTSFLYNLVAARLEPSSPYDDLAVTGWDSQLGSTIDVYHSNGDGTFSLLNQIAISTLNVQGYATSIVAADFNGDKSPDLAVSLDWGNKVAVLLNQGNGSFTLKSTSAVGTEPV